MAVHPLRWLVISFEVALLFSLALVAQEGTLVPQLVRFTGTIAQAQGTVGVTFAIYAQQTGDAPLWLETQNVTSDTTGRYTVDLGATQAHGLPLGLFSRGEARWIGVKPEGQPEQARILLVAVPYALKAADADTLGGLPASAYLLAPSAVAGGGTATANLIAVVDGATVTASSSAGASKQTIVPEDNFDPHSPGPIGDVTPSTGQFTQLSLVGTDSNHSFVNTVATKGAANSFCWPRKLWIYGADGTTVDDAVAWGYNCTNNAGDDAFTFSMEHNYETVSGAHQNEYYMQLHKAGQTAWRPLGFSFNVDDGDSTQWGFLIGDSTTGGSGFSLGTHAGVKIFSAQNGTFQLNTEYLQWNYALAGNPQLAVGNSKDLLFVVGSTGYYFTRDSRGLVPAGDNTTDLGGNSSRWRNGHFGTSVYTPKLAGITDTTLVANLNADLLDGHHASDFAPAGSIGTVTSVGLSAPSSDFTVSGSPVTTAGTLNLAWNVAPTNLNVTNAIVKRDSSTGGFNAGEVTLSTLLVQKPPNGTGGNYNLSAIDLKPLDGTGHSFRSYSYGGDGNPDFYLDGGYLYSRNAVTISGNSSGTGGGYRIIPATLDPTMLSINADIGGPAMQVATANAAGSYNASFLDTSKNYVLSIENDGRFTWSATTRAAIDTGLGRCAVGTLCLGNGSSGDYSGTLHSGTLIATNLMVSGAKNSVVPLADDKVALLYAVESPENWFEDFGSGRLHNGVAQIEIDPSYAKTVNTGVAYHVFLTPNANCRGLYVARKTATGFIIRELGHGHSNAAFDYRIVAKRNGFEKVRLEQLQAQPATVQAMRQEMRAPRPTRFPSDDDAAARTAGSQ